MYVNTILELTLLDKKDIDLIAPIVVEFLFLIATGLNPWQLKKECNGKREKDLLVHPKLSLQNFVKPPLPSCHIL